ncbi:HDOD domain-containing protein [Methylophaga sp.]|uniref:HDOD domain-containing protein n=1 Tax=Methylophaga sp. TaxID=2024840 RepID=UPI0027171095|nr:HDOD domain-containing protein [Methylophaga sp.]MDO8826025.1 HDOD domain-containing protein [Methylophaga sp.]
MALTPQILVNKSLNLVSSTETYAQLDALICDPDSSIEDMAVVINTDPALVSRLLKIVNSSFYGLPSKIDTISRAITIVGVRELRALVLATSVINSFRGIPSSLVNMDKFWRHSLACAIAARLIAEETKQPEPEQFFIAGLLHNIGSLVLYQSLPEMALEAMRSASDSSESLYEAETRIIGFHHGEVGAVLIENWGLPDKLACVSRYLQYPLHAPDHKQLVATVYVASALVDSVQLGLGVATVDESVLNLINIDASLLPVLLERVNEQQNSVTDFLSEG